MTRDWLGNVWEPTSLNLARVLAAEKAIFSAESLNGTPETRLADTLADLMHWAAANGVNYDAAATRALRYYSEERGS